MAAIFYNAVEQTVGVEKVLYYATTPGKIYIIVKGTNPGYAKGDKVTYKNGTITVTGVIEGFTTGGISTSYPNGYYSIILPDAYAATRTPLVGGTLIPVAASTPVTSPPIVSSPTNVNAEPPFVSAATILKDGDPAALAPDASEIPTLEAASFMGLSKKAWIAVGIVGIAAFVLPKMLKFKKK